MGTAFRTLFWGFIFLFDLRINDFDILPDVIAYYLFYAGLSGLAAVSPRFGEARVFTIPLLFLSILDINPAWFPLSGSLMSVYVILTTILNLIMIYGICTGIKEVAAAKQDRELAATAQSRWALYLISAFAAASLQLLAIASSVSGLWAILIFIFGLVVFVLLLDLMRKSEARIR